MPNITPLRKTIASYLGKVLTPEIAADIEASVALVPLAPAEEAKKLSPPWELWSPDGLLELVCGNEWAARFLLDISAWSHAYDDLIDRDKDLSDDAIHGMVWRMLIDIPSNPFFIEYQAELRPVLMTSIINWRASNDMERSGCLEQLRISHATRYELCDLLLLCMALTGGKDHAASNARRARLMGQNDTWANYRAEHFKQEKKAC